MENNGQLTFSDDPLLKGINEVYSMIETGEFTGAVKDLDALMDINPDYPGLTASYRTARFWLNRESESKKLKEGKDTANFFMNEWAEFEIYSAEKEMKDSAAYTAAMRFVFSTASENYRISYLKRELSQADNFSLLISLGSCFLKLGEYKQAAATLEFAKNSYSASAKLLFILGEAYWHLGDIPKSLLYYREGFLIDPSEADIDSIKAKPIMDIIAETKILKRESPDIREWIPVIGYVKEIFYVRRNVSKSTIDMISSEVFSLEKNYSSMGKDQIDSTSILPKMINKYLWLLDYYEFQSYNYENIAQIRERLIKLEHSLFREYFEKKARGRAD